MWYLVFICLETVLASVLDRCTVCAKRTIGSKILLDAPDGTPRLMWVMLNLVSVHLEIVLGSVQDWCMVCAKRTYARESFWTHPMVLLGDETPVEAHLGLFGDSANIDAR